MKLYQLAMVSVSVLGLIAFAYSSKAEMSFALASESAQPPSVEEGYGGTFDLISEETGTVRITRIVVGKKFPTLKTGGILDMIRLYYSPVGFDDVTLASPHVSFELLWNWTGEPLVKGDRVRGLASGVRYYFKLAFITEDGRIGFFTPNAEVDFDRHSVVVQ